MIFAIRSEEKGKTYDCEIICNGYILRTCMFGY